MLRSEWLYCRGHYWCEDSNVCFLVRDNFELRFVLVHDINHSFREVSDDGLLSVGLLLDGFEHFCLLIKLAVVFECVDEGLLYVVIPHLPVPAVRRVKPLGGFLVVGYVIDELLKIFDPFNNYPHDLRRLDNEPMLFYLLCTVDWSVGFDLCVDCKIKPIDEVSRSVFEKVGQILFKVLLFVVCLLDQRIDE